MRKCYLYSQIANEKVGDMYVLRCHQLRLLPGGKVVVVGTGGAAVSDVDMLQWPMSSNHLW